MQIAIIILLIIITIQNFIMNNDLQEIKDKLIAADLKIDKVGADVVRLHEIINASGELPTAEEWADVKNIATSLNDKLQVVDDQTAE